MNLEQAKILREAADFIERNPGLYDYYALRVPECGAPGCVLGWIGVASGFMPNTCNVDVARSIGYSDTSPFYSAMGSVGRKNGLWTKSATEAAYCLRKLAGMYESDRNFAAECLDMALNGPKLLTHDPELA